MSSEETALDVIAEDLHEDHADWCADDVCAVNFDAKAQRILSAF